MIKKIFTNKIYFLITLLVLLVLLSIIASVSPNKGQTNITNLNPFATNKENNVDTTNLNEVEDPVLKFFLDQNKILKSQMNLVNQIDQDVPTPVIVWKVDFK